MANQQKQQVDQKESASSKHTFLVDDETYEIYEVEEEAEHDADEEMIGADDDENLLIQNTDGTMSIKIKTEQDTTVLVEHVCGKCRKSYKSVEVIFFQLTYFFWLFINVECRAVIKIAYETLSNDAVVVIDSTS